MNPPTEDTTNPDGPKEGIIGNNQPNNSGNNQFKNSGNLADNNSVNPGYNNPPDILSEEENGNPGTKNTKLPDNRNQEEDNSISNTGDKNLSGEENAMSNKNNKSNKQPGKELNDQFNENPGEKGNDK